MQILKIKLSQDEQDDIFIFLTDMFIEESKCQRLQVELNNQIEYEAVLELYSEYSEPDENNQNHLESRSVMKFNLNFFHNGDEVDVQDWDIEDRIKKYYEV